MSAEKITRVSDMYNIASAIYKGSVAISRSSLFLMIEALIGLKLVIMASGTDPSIFVPFLIIVVISVGVNTAYLQNRDIDHIKLQERYDYFVEKYSTTTAHSKSEVKKDLYYLVDMTERHIWKHVIVSVVNSITIVLMAVLLCAVVSGATF